MVDERTERVLYLWLLPEISFLLVLGILIAASLLGVRTGASAYSRPLRIAVLAFVIVELLIPAWVYVDLRWRDDEPDRMWIHAAAMPLVNLVGLLGYLEDRRRSLHE